MTDVPAPSALETGRQKASAGRPDELGPMARTITVHRALVTALTRMASRDRGATAVEYVLLAALVVAVVVAVVATLGHRVDASTTCLASGVG